VYFTTIHKI